jgi:molybdopterin-guanine dinucleotide biosynthesis protein A
MRTSHLLTLAIDMPFMTARELGSLLERATQGRGIVPTIGDRAESLAAIYPAEAVEDFRASLASSDFSLQLLVRKLAATGKITLWPIAKEDPRLYRSVNEFGDLPVD